jgi:hypothetical protein
MYFKKLINVSFDIKVHLFLNKKMVNLFQDKTRLVTGLDVFQIPAQMPAVDIGRHLK